MKKRIHKSRSERKLQKLHTRRYIAEKARELYKKLQDGVSQSIDEDEELSSESSDWKEVSSEQVKTPTNE